MLLVYYFTVMFNSCYVKGILVYVVRVVQKDLKHFQVCEIPTDKLFILFKKTLHILEKKGGSTFSFNLEKKGKQHKRENREEGRKGGRDRKKELKFQNIDAC